MRGLTQCTGQYPTLDDNDANSSLQKSPETLVYDLQSPSSTLVRRHANATFPRPNLETHRVHLHGFIDYDYTSALEFYRPVVQSYPPAGLNQPAHRAGLSYLRTAVLIEHLDVCTVLKGLPLADAEIMLSIDQIFRTSLEDVLASQLQQMEWDARRELLPYDLDTSDGTVGPMAARYLGFRLNELVQAMLKRMQPESHRWDQRLCQSSLLMHVLQYLTTRDCLIDIEPREYHDTAVQIRLHHVGVPRPTAEVIRNPDFLCFEQLDPLPREGQPFRVIPRYRHGAFDGEDDVDATAEYSIEPAIPWLTWKPELGGFVGTIPLYSEMAPRTVPGLSGIVHMGSVGNYTDVHCLRFEVKAILIENFVTKARLERTIRTRLNIKVIPWYAHPSAIAPKGPSFDSLVIDQDVAATLSSWATEGAVESRIQKPANIGTPSSSTSACLLNKDVSAPSTLEDRKFSEAQKPYSPWPICDLSNYDVSSIFAEHKPYHKSKLIPGSPRKHVDEMFNLDRLEEIDYGRGAVTDVQVYHVTGLDSTWHHRPEPRWLELTDIRTTQHSEGLANVVVDSRNSLQPDPVGESNGRDNIRTSDEHGGCLDGQPASEPSLELAPAGGTTRHLSIGRDHNRPRGHRSFSTYDEEAERQESLHFPRNAMRKKDQRRWLDASLSPSLRSRRQLSYGDLDAAELEYDDRLSSCAEADQAQETNELPESWDGFESGNGSANVPLHSAPRPSSVQIISEAGDCKESHASSSLKVEGDDNDCQSEKQKVIKQSTDAASANFPVALKLRAHKSARRAGDVERGAGHRPGINIRKDEPRKSRESHTSEDVDRFADFRFTFDCDPTTHHQAENVDYFSNFRSIFNRPADADHAAEVADYFADFRSAFEDRTRSNSAAEDIDIHMYSGPGFDRDRYGGTGEPVEQSTLSRWIFEFVTSTEGEDESPEHFFADFRHAFDDRPGINHVAEAVDFSGGFREASIGPGRGRPAEPIDHFVQLRWMFGGVPRVEGGDELSMDYFADFRSFFDDGTESKPEDGVARFFADFWKFVDGSPRCGRVAEPVDYFTQSRWMFGPVANIGGEDGLSLDYFADFRHIFEDMLGTSRVSEMAEYIAQSRPFLDESQGCGPVVEPVHYFAQSRWMFGRDDDEDEFLMKDFADFRSILDDSNGTEGNDHPAEFWSFSDDAVEDVDYILDPKSTVDSGNGSEEDQLSVDAGVASGADSPPAIPHTPKRPHITCFFNRYSPLRRTNDANIDIASDISSEDHRETVSLLQELPNLSPTDYHSSNIHLPSYASSSSPAALYRRPSHPYRRPFHPYHHPSHPYRRPPHPNYNSTSYYGPSHFAASSSSGPPPIHSHRLITPHTDSLPPITYRKPRHLTPHTHSRASSSSTQPPPSRASSTFTSSRLVSSTLEIVIENDDVDPRLRREQALLWSLLGTRDERLAREERKSVWEAMRLGAVEGGEEEEGLDGEDFDLGFGEDEEGGQSEGETAVGSECEGATVVGEEF